MSVDAGTRKPLPAGARATVAVCVLGMAAVALWAPYEILDGNFERVDTARKWIFSNPPPGRGFWRLHLWRLCFEQGLFLAVIIGVTVASRVTAPSDREPDALPPGDGSRGGGT